MIQEKNHRSLVSIFTAKQFLGKIENVSAKSKLLNAKFWGEN